MQSALSAAGGLGLVVNKVVWVAGASGGARGASLVQGGAGGARAHMSVGSGRVRGTLFPGIARGTLVSVVGPRWPCGWCRVVLWGLVSWFGCLWRGFASVALWSRVGCLREAFRGLVSLSLGLPGPPVLALVMLCYIRLCSINQSEGDNGEACVATKDNIPEMSQMARAETYP